MEDTNVQIQIKEYNIDDPTAGVEAVASAIPEPQQGQVLVRMKLRPINPADVFSVQGIYPGFHPASLPATPGLDGVGEVVKNGPGTAGKFAPGQRVVAGPWHTSDGNGTWAKYVLVDENRLYAVPDTLSDDVACQFATNPLTAVGFFKILEPELKHGDWILNNAAASALGRMVIKLAKKKGFKTINVVRRRNVVEELLALGADACIVSTEEDVVARVKELTQGQGVKVALDPVVGEGLATMTGACAVGGTVVVYGMMEGAAANVSVVDVLFRKVVVKGFWVGKWLEEDLHGEEKDEIMKETIDLMADGTLAAPIGAKFSLQQIAEAVAECNKPGKRGKPVLEG